MRKYHLILGVKIDSSQTSELLDYIASSLKEKKKIRIYTPNPEILVEATKDANYRRVLNKADINIADGKGLLLSSMNLHILPGRVLFKELVNKAAIEGWKVCLIGSSEKVNNKATEKLLKEFPKIEVLGMSGPRLSKDGSPDTEEDSKILKDILRDISYFNPDIIFVAFGHPKQELFIDRYFDQINAKCIMAIGGTLDSFVDEHKLPPNWISNLGLEWLWRLILEPSRLPRILNATISFPYFLLREKVLYLKGKIGH